MSDNAPDFIEQWHAAMIVSLFLYDLGLAPQTSDKKGADYPALCSRTVGSIDANTWKSWLEEGKKPVVPIRSM